MRNVALHVYVFVVGGLLMLGLVAAAGDAVPKRRRSEFDRALAERRRPSSRVREVERIEREVTLARPHAPTTCTPACCRTCARSPRRASSGRARSPSPETLGRWWELLRPDRPSPTTASRPASRRRICARSSPTLRGCSAMELTEVGRLANAHPRRGREGRAREARRARAAAARPARRRPRADRGLPRPREDADGALVRAGRRRSTSPASSSRPT